MNTQDRNIKRLLDQLIEMTKEADQNCYKHDRDSYFNDTLADSYALINEIYNEYSR